MAKYKLLTQSGYDSGLGLTMGRIYDNSTVGTLIASYPKDWELIEEIVPKGKIIGYNLIYPEYEKVALKALGMPSYAYYPFIIIGSIGYYMPKIKDLGMESWFEPVYEQIKEEIMNTEKTITLSLDQAKKMYGKNPEMDELLLANFSKEELAKKSLPKSWKELKNVQGYRITAEGHTAVADADCTKELRMGRFATEKQAKSALAMAQLGQLMAVYNDGWEPDWVNTSQNKFSIHLERGKIETYGGNWYTHKFLTFKTAEIRKEFLLNFWPLIKEYFMID